MKVRMAFWRWGDRPGIIQELELFEGNLGEVLARGLLLSKMHHGYPGREGDGGSGISLVWAEHLDGKQVATFEKMNRRTKNPRWRIYVEPGDHEAYSTKMEALAAVYTGFRIPYIEGREWNEAQIQYANANY